MVANSLVVAQFSDKKASSVKIKTADKSASKSREEEAAGLREQQLRNFRDHTRIASPLAKVEALNLVMVYWAKAGNKVVTQHLLLEAADVAGSASDAQEKAKAFWAWSAGRLDKGEVSKHMDMAGYYKTKTPLPVVFLNDESLERYKLNATPTTLLISAEGTVEHAWVGRWDPAQTLEVTETLK